MVGGGAGDARPCRSAWSPLPASATTRRSSPRRRPRWRRCSPAGSGWRWGRARLPTSTSPATAGRRRRCAPPACGSAWTSSARCTRGEEVTHEGLVHVDRARIWTLPDAPPALIGAAVSAATAAWGRAGPTASSRSTSRIERLASPRRLPRRRGPGKAPSSRSTSPTPGTTKPRSRIAHDQWRTNVFATAGVLGPRVCRATSTRWPAVVRPEDVRRSVLVSSDPAPACGLDQRARRPGIRRDIPPPRRPGPAGVHRRLRREGPPPARRARPVRITDTSDLWWKTAVVYCLDIETFLDSDGDGIGDLAGLVQRIDYLAELGVTCLWLMPIYPTPDRDDGYDITDFYGVDPRLGTTATSSSWSAPPATGAFGSSSTSSSTTLPTATRGSAPPGPAASPYRDWYVWRDDPPPTTPTDIVFPDQETSIWQYDEKAGQYYLHRFYRHQPDLNVANPAVRDEIAEGDGVLARARRLRLPRRRRAVPHREHGVTGDQTSPIRTTTSGTCGRSSTATRRRRPARRGEPPTPGPAALLRGRTATSSDALRLHRHAAPVPFAGPRDAGRSPTRSSAGPRSRRLPMGNVRAQPRRADARQAHRGGARRSLRRLRPRARHADLRTRAAPAAPTDARRRPAPDPHGLQPAVLAAGTPVLFYGEEIGMGEELAAEGRNAVRTPDAVDTAATAGSPTPAAVRLPGPVVEGGFGPEHVNVEAQRRDPDSLLRSSPACPPLPRSPRAGMGRPRGPRPALAPVLAHLVRLDDDVPLGGAQPLRGAPNRPPCGSPTLRSWGSAGSTSSAMAARPRRRPWAGRAQHRRVRYYWSPFSHRAIGASPDETAQDSEGSDPVTSQMWCSMSWR